MLFDLNSAEGKRKGSHMTRGRIIWWCTLLLMLAAVSSFEERRRQVVEADGIKALEKLVEVNGHINSIYHQGLEHAPVRGAIVVFQRMHEEHFVAVRVDSDGYYEVFLEKGSYRVIIPRMKPDGTGKTEMMAKNREKYIDIEENISGVHFDFEIDHGDL